MIRIPDINNRTAEYTARCGWVDWNHAGGNPDDRNAGPRTDVETLWRQFPQPPSGDNGPNVQKSPGGGGFFVTHEPDVDSVAYAVVHLRVNTHDIRPNGEGGYTAGPARRYFVRWNSLANYKRIALQIYQAGCVYAEQLQQEYHDWFTGSAFSFEDYASNLIAFYRVVEGTEVNRVCGRIVLREDRPEISKRVLREMNQRGVIQRGLRPASEMNWYQAYLFNYFLFLAIHWDHAERIAEQILVFGGIPNGPNGWANLPEELRSIRRPPDGHEWYWRDTPENSGRTRRFDRRDAPRLG